MPKIHYFANLGKKIGQLFRASIRMPLAGRILISYSLFYGSEAADTAEPKGESGNASRSFRVAPVKAPNENKVRWHREKFALTA